MNDIDYRKLLIKYMAEVLECEGVSFVGTAYPYAPYTPEERAELERIEREAHKQNNPD